MKHRIKVTIKPGGEIITEVNGVQGDICEVLSSWTDDLGEVVEHHRTDNEIVFNQAILEVGV